MSFTADDRSTSPTSPETVPAAWASVVTGWRSQYVYHFFPRSRTLSGHISTTKRGASKNYAAIDWATVAQLKSVEFSEAPLFVVEIGPLKV